MLRAPAKPAIMEVKTRFPSAPGLPDDTNKYIVSYEKVRGHSSVIRCKRVHLPAMKEARLPLSAQPPILHANVPSGKPGRDLLYLFINFHLARQPNGVKRRLIRYGRCAGKNMMAKINDTNVAKNTNVAHARTEIYRRRRGGSCVLG